MNSISRICWASAPFYLLVGMGFGIWMSASGDHALAPAHAHLNLIGGVLIALFGAFYSLYPGSAAGLLAKLQVACAHLAVWTMFPGIIMAIRGQGEILAKVGSLLAIASALLFLMIVLRTAGKSSA